MLGSVINVADAGAALNSGAMLAGILGTSKSVLYIVVGFSLVIFMHELGHFLMAKLANVRVEKFAIGFGRTIFAYRKGIGVRLGPTAGAFQRRIETHIAAKRGRPIEPGEELSATDAELAAATKELGIGETEYALNILPVGGYVKMLGQEDFAVDKSGEWVLKRDPRSFSCKPVGVRMLIVSAGVVMNLIFAAFLFMLVFMIGQEVMTPVIGAPLPGTPAERAGLQYGDRILEVNGREIQDYDDFRMSVVLAEPHTPLRLKLKRDGRVIECSVTPENDPDRNLLQIGVPPKFTRVIADVQAEPGPPRPDALQVNDEVLEVDGTPVRDFFEVYYRLQAAQGRRVTLLVDRPDPKDPSKKTRVTCTRQAWLRLAGTGDDRNEVGHLLGLVPRLRVTRVQPNSPAELSGIKEGDVIAEWANIKAPTLPEVVASVENHPGVDLDVTLIRNGERVQTCVRPEQTGFWKTGKPQVGFDLAGQEAGPVVVAGIVPQFDGRPTPAAALQGPLMPRGSIITKVNGEPVATWNELAARFVKAAGQTVQLAWRYGNEPERTAPLPVPADVTTLAGMPPLGRILDIAGQESIETTRPDGKVVSYAAKYWRGAYEILKKWQRENPGRPVTLRYRDVLDPTGRIVETTVNITPETLDPWTLRLQYSDYIIGNPETVLAQTWNPIKAMSIGVTKTVDIIVQAYVTMKRMIFTRSVGAEHISGPVGIFQLGVAVAESGIAKLLFFLAFLSANLAVINFLPLPIVDGGLMVFLIIEKIKGKPVSLKIQMVTQIVGLALLATAFLLVTWNDFTKL